MAASRIPRALDVQRWMPPDVGPKAEEPEPLQLPSAEEIAAVEEAARSAGAEAGFQEGYQAGYQEGRDKAAAEAEAERAVRESREAEQRQIQERTLKETVAALEGVAGALADPLSTAVDELEPELLALVEALARRVIMAELSTRPELIQGVLHEALEQLPSRKHPVRVRLHPDQQSVLELYAESRGEQIDWLADPEIEPGGCLVESGPSRIDATLDARLRQGIDAIWGELTRPEPAAAPEPILESQEDESLPRADEADVAVTDLDMSEAPDGAAPDAVAEVDPESSSEPSAAEADSAAPASEEQP